MYLADPCERKKERKLSAFRALKIIGQRPLRGRRGGRAPSAPPGSACGYQGSLLTVNREPCGYDPR